MTDTEKKKYYSLAESIKDFLEYKLYLLDAEASGKKAQRGDPSLAKISAICEAGSFAFSLTDEKRQKCIGLIGKLSDMLEAIYQLTIDEKNARESGMDEDVKRMIPVVMSGYRKQLFLLDEIGGAISEPLTDSERYIPDDRLELIILALKKTTEFKSIIEKEYKLNKFVFALGFILIGLSALLFFGVLILLITDSVTELLYYLNASGALSAPIERTSLSSTLLFVYLKRGALYSFILFILYFILIKVYLKHLKKKSEQGNVSARYVLAFYRLNPFGLSLKIDQNGYLYELMECAESGYPPALYRVGIMYERGYGKLIARDLQLAMQYYSRAARYVKDAKTRYDILSGGLG
jgi:hypothetical protein